MEEKATAVCVRRWCFPGVQWRVRGASMAKVTMHGRREFWGLGVTGTRNPNQNEYQVPERKLPENAQPLSSMLELLSPSFSPTQLKNSDGKQLVWAVSQFNCLVLSSEHAHKQRSLATLCYVSADFPPPISLGSFLTVSMQLFSRKKTLGKWQQAYIFVLITGFTFGSRCFPI